MQLVILGHVALLSDIHILPATVTCVCDSMWLLLRVCSVVCIGGINNILIFILNTEICQLFFSYFINVCYDYVVYILCK